MPLGPGRYDEELSAALASARRGGNVEGGILIIVFGEAGKRGFSCQATAALTLRIPEILRVVADGIEADIARGEL